jgi:ubiquinone/menaquinone biosynthesis C-methylase UbiE
MRPTLDYNSIAEGYNRTRQADATITEKLSSFVKQNQIDCFVDIGCGTGNYTIELAKKGGVWYGLEPSISMLDEASKKYLNINWIQGSAESMNFPECYFSGAIATLTIHHWSDLQKSFQKISSVLNHQAHLVIFTSTPEQMAGYWLNHYFPEMLKKSIEKMPSLQLLTKYAAESNLKLIVKEPYFVDNELMDLFLYSGKHNPKIYFQKDVQNGISSFSMLANQEEITYGLKQLSKDLRIGQFEKIKNKYANNFGDYTFVVFEKL